jgi:hypothetical protein
MCEISILLKHQKFIVYLQKHANTLSIVQTRFNDASCKRSALSAPKHYWSIVMSELPASTQVQSRSSTLYLRAHFHYHSFLTEYGRFQIWSWNEDLTTALPFSALVGSCYGRSVGIVRLRTKGHGVLSWQLELLRHMQVGLGNIKPLPEYRLRHYIVTYRPTARQRLGKHTPVEAQASNNRTSIAR